MSWGGRIENYFRDLFKPMTLIAFILFYIGLIVRFTDADTEEDFTAARCVYLSLIYNFQKTTYASRIIMAIDIELWWLRFLTFIIVIPYLGPNLVAILKMVLEKYSRISLFCSKFLCFVL